MTENMKDTATLAIVGLFLAGIGGWVANIVKLVNADVFSGMEVARVIGILFAPLGAILGFL